MKHFKFFFSLNDPTFKFISINIAKPSVFERFLVIMVQGIFFNLYFVMYLVSPRTCHRVVGYFEEQAIISYTEYLDEIENTDGVTTDIKKIINPIIKECRKIPNSNIIILFSIIF